MGISAAIVGGSLIAGYMSSEATGNAADTQADAARSNAQLQKQSADEQLAFQKQQYAENLARQEPWYQAGKTALSQLSAGTAAGGEFNGKYTPSDLYADPSYAWRLSQGQKALENSAAARGIQFSGGTLAGVNEYAQNAASQEYQNAFNRYQTDVSNRYNRLAGVAGTGQQAVNQMGAAGSNYAGAAGGILSNMTSGVISANNAAANASAAGQIAQANTFGNTLGQASQLYGMYNTYQQGQNAQNAALASQNYAALDPTLYATSTVGASGGFGAFGY